MSQSNKIISIIVVGSLIGIIVNEYRHDSDFDGVPNDEDEFPNNMNEWNDNMHLLYRCIHHYHHLGRYYLDRNHHLYLMEYL